ncbi:ATP synthase subunit I [Neisseriaceae bacterium CLB008]
MTKLIGYQALTLAVVLVLTYLVADLAAVWSSLLGGLSYLLPTCVATLFLSLTNHNVQRMALGFVLGESLKIILAIIMMVVVFIVYPTLRWPYFLVGFLAVSHVIFIVFWKFKHYGRRSHSYGSRVR